MVKVSQTSYDYTRPYWDQIGATLVGRHVFDMTDGWDRSLRRDRPRGRRDAPAGARGWDPEAPFHFVDGVEAAVAKAQELAVTAWSRSPLARRWPGACRGPVDEVRMDVVPVVFVSGKRYFASVHAQHLFGILTW